MRPLVDNSWKNKPKRTQRNPFKRRFWAKNEDWVVCFFLKRTHCMGAVSLPVAGVERVVGGEGVDLHIRPVRLNSDAPDPLL